MSTAVMTALATMPAHAQNATWSTDPAAGDNYNLGTNWSTGAVPTGIASFGPTSASGTSPLVLSSATINQFQFLAGAPSYSIGVIGPATLTFNDGGVTQNLSGNNQVIVVTTGGTIQFNDSTAGNSTIGYSNRGGAIVFNDGTAGSAGFENEDGGAINFINSDAGTAVISNNVGAATVTFQGTSTADNATISNTTTGGGQITFTDTSTAGTATLDNFGTGNNITFESSSTAANAIINNNVGNTTTFTDSASAGQSIITNAGTLNFMGTSTGDAATITTESGGTTTFSGSSTGGTARIITEAGGVFSIAPLTSGGMTTGSIEGAGSYVLGTNELTTGLNNLSTTVSGVISGTGGSLIKEGTGTLTLSGANTYSGPTLVADGTLAAGAVNAFSASSNTTVESGGTLALQGFNQTLTNGLTNAGTVQLGVPGVTPPGTTLTVNNYIGNNGVLALNTFLGTDGSASDQLVVNGGTATGTTSLNITNVGGPGAETTSNGILVVNAINGATTTGAFTLDNPELRAGAFDYRLFMGGLNGTDPNDWFLRSTFMDNGGGEPIGPSPPPDPLPPGAFPIIGPELATYGVVQPTARQLGLATLGTLNQRIGDTMTLANTGSDLTGWSRSEWGRFFGQQVDDHYQAFADPRTSGWLGGFQGGLDLWRGELLPGLLPGRDATGVYVAYGHANMDVSGLVTNPQSTAYMLTHTGMVGMDAFSTGTYWTHYGPSGWYLDAVLQGSVYTTNATTQFAALTTDGYGFVASLESGYPIALPFFGPHFVIEPQAQIIWQQVGFGSANDGLGPVALGSTSGTTGRLGVRGQWTMQDYGGMLWQPYVGVNFWHDWGGNAATTFGTDSVPLLDQATRTETFGGVTVKLSDHLSAYTQGGYQFAMEQTFYGIRRDGVHADLGLRYSW